MEFKNCVQSESCGFSKVGLEGSKMAQDLKLCHFITSGRYKDQNEELSDENMTLGENSNCFVLRERLATLS